MKYNRTLETKHFNCPRCGERISMVLDLSVAYQRYIEDCEVCCCPVEISYQTEDNVLVYFEASVS